MSCKRATAGTSPARLTTSHLECGRLVASHPDPSSHATCGVWRLSSGLHAGLVLMRRHARFPREA